MKPILFLSLIGATAVLATAQTTVSAVVNAASNTVVGLPNSAIAQGATFVAYGANMGPAKLVQVSSYPLPTSAGLSGTSAKVTVNGNSVDVIMIYTSANQIAGIVPSNAPTGTGTLSVTYNGQTGSTPITVVQSNFGIYAINQAGSGPGIVTFADNSLAGISKAANPGETLVIWGTGLGPVSGNEASAPQPGDQPGVPVKVWVGGQAAAIAYRGRSGCCSGLDQIAFVVPSGVTGCSVPVYVQIGNTVSNPVTTSVAATGRTCVDSSGLDSTYYQQLFAQGTISIGSVGLIRSTSTTTGVGGFGGGTTKSDDGSAVFLKITVPQGGLLSLVGTINVGACSITTFNGQSVSQFANFTYSGLDAGASIGVTGPAGSKTLTKTAAFPGAYSAQLGNGTAGNYLDPGTYTISGPGGADVGSFSTSLTLPPALVWTNQDSISTVNRSNGQSITWSGGDPTAFVDIGGSSIALLSNNKAVGASFNCHVRVSDGSFTVPSYVLLSLPASSTVSGFALPGGLSVSTTPVSKPFTVKGLDFATVSSTVEISKSVTYQ